MRSTQPPALVAADAMFDAGRCLPDSGKRLSRAYGLRRGASGDLWSRSSDRGPQQRRRPAIKAASLVDGERGSAGSMCPGRRRSRVRRWLAEARECPPEKIGLFLVLETEVKSNLVPVHSRLEFDWRDFLAVEPQTHLTHKVAERSPGWACDANRKGVNRHQMRSSVGRWGESA